MTTITYKPGASGPFVVRFEDDDGAALDYGRAQLRIQRGAQCLMLDGRPAEAGWQFDMDALDLPPRLYTASIYYDAGEGWRLGEMVNLYVQGGC